MTQINLRHLLFLKKILDKKRYIRYIMVKQVIKVLNMKNIEKVQAEIQYLQENTETVIVGLKDYLEHLTNYYELMRWHKLECSSEEYAELYDKGVYEIEEMDALDRIKGTIEFLEKIKQN